MKRFDLLRSPLLLLAVGVLLLNDFVLKAAFHNWLTGKLSDFAGLAAFTIFCCALWPRHVWRVGGGIAIFFTFWKSPYPAGLIDAANAVLPFSIGRVVDTSDLIALPVVWLVCRNAHRLPLVDVGKIGVWLTAGVCLFAFAATSSIEHGYTLSRAAEVPAPSQAAEESALQAAIDMAAAAHGLHCVRCASLSEGRTYRSGGPLMISAGFDAKQNRLLFNVSAYAAHVEDAEKARPEVERVRADIEQKLRERFAAVTFSDWTGRVPRATTIVIEVVLSDDRFDQAFAIVGDVLKRAGLKVEKTANGGLSGRAAEEVRWHALSAWPVLASHAFFCRREGKLVVEISSYLPDHERVQRRIVGDLERELGRAFGEAKTSAGPRTGPPCT